MTITQALEMARALVPGDILDGRRSTRSGRSLRHLARPGSGNPDLEDDAIDDHGLLPERRSQDIIDREALTQAANQLQALYVRGLARSSIPDSEDPLSGSPLERSRDAWHNPERLVGVSPLDASSGRQRRHCQPHALWVSLRQTPHGRGRLTQ